MTVSSPPGPVVGASQLAAGWRKGGNGFRIAATGITSGEMYSVGPAPT